MPTIVGTPTARADQTLDAVVDLYDDGSCVVAVSVNAPVEVLDEYEVDTDDQGEPVLDENGDPVPAVDGAGNPRPKTQRVTLEGEALLSHWQGGLDAAIAAELAKRPSPEERALAAQLAE